VAVAEIGVDAPAPSQVGGVVGVRQGEAFQHSELRFDQVEARGFRRRPDRSNVVPLWREVSPISRGAIRAVGSPRSLAGEMSDIMSDLEFILNHYISLAYVIAELKYVRIKVRFCVRKISDFFASRIHIFFGPLSL
jgi:hypothetical protein